MFDPDYGTPEERAKVETARENFRKNRFKVKPSSNLLWKMQVISSLYFDITNAHGHTYTHTNRL